MNLPHQSPVIVSINERELKELEFFRVGLSEETIEQRLKTLTNIKIDILGRRIEDLYAPINRGWDDDPQNFELLKWIAQFSNPRVESAFELREAGDRYETKNERKLNVAEHIGDSIFVSIFEGRYRGLHSRSGILEQVSHDARSHDVIGGRDKDTLRKLWGTYRGVAHLGMAFNYLGDHPFPELNILDLAEHFRNCLSQNCPKGTKKPYVDVSEQISFIYQSVNIGPRLNGQGLPYFICE